MAGLKAVARVTLDEQVARQVAGMIDGKRWKLGEKLPPEDGIMCRAECRAFDIARSAEIARFRWNGPNARWRRHLCR